MAINQMLRLILFPNLFISLAKSARRSSCWSVFLATATATTIVCAQTDLQPYMVYVDQEGVSARCGPGGDYYRTDPLRHGQALEVYVETPDGWLGIRPPDNSFCWLPADVLKLSPNQDFGTVTEDNALAWIGTHLGKANKYLWQVQLAKGEEVAILGRAKREGPDGIKLWYRVVPPAGEFRWVHRDQIVDNPELLLREKPAPGSRLAMGEPTIAPDSHLSEQLSSNSTSRRENRRELRSVLQREDYMSSPDNEPQTASNQHHLSLPVPQPDVPQSNRSDADADRLAYDNESTNEIIGSGVIAASSRNDRQDDMTIAKPYEAPLVAFTTRPTVHDIGQRSDTPAPPADQLVDSFGRRNSPQNVSAVVASYETRELPTQSNSARVDARPISADDHRVSVYPAVVPASNVSVHSPGTPRSVDALQLELSRMMSRSARANELNQVVAEAMQLASAGNSDADRARASMIVQRAQQYQSVAQRRDGEVASGSLGPMTPGSTSSGSMRGSSMTVSYPDPVLASPSPGASYPGMASDNGSTSEAKGFLVQVFSARPDSPPFALTDTQGRTTHYVSPAPGVNLRRFLNQFISVRGTSGYSTGLDTPHVIASGALRVPE